MTSGNIGLEKSDGLGAILFGGLIAGTLDITAASVSVWLNSGRSALWTFQSVAGGIYGKSTFEGGYATAALGLTLHFFIALTATAVYYLASRKLKFMVSQAILCGVLYGIAVYLFMYYVVIPLTPLGMPSPTFISVLRGVLIHIFCVGLPISLVVRRFSK